MKEFPTLVTNRLFLRKPTQKDELPQLKIFQDEETMRYFGMEPINSIEKVKNLLQWSIDSVEQDKGIRWIISLKETDECIGDIGFHNWDKKNFKCELGAKLERGCWGKGFMSEAAKKALDYAFLKMNVNRIEGFVDPGNIPCLKLVKRLEFQVEGLLRDYEFENGKFVDLQIISLLKREWKKK